MKRFHVHVAVVDLRESVRFYSELFGSAPSVQKTDYAKWMLDDPLVNFAISQRGAAPGIQHLGIQVETPTELEAVHARLQRAGGPIREEGATTCCYAHGEKNWIDDTQGIQWETFLTTGQSTVYGRDPMRAGKVEAAESPCCGPSPSCCSSSAA
jgi:catechol 2,3-dioxygenase-like lactoylglutathione lyase family enzyme